MRINILTQPLFVNYGGILQNYALQEVLRRLGHEPLTVNIPVSMPKRGGRAMNMLRTVRNAWRKVRGRYYAPFLNPYKFAVKERELSRPQRDFITRYIANTDASAPFTASTAATHPADAWIVGSDQVWRPWCSPYIENCFLDFVGEETLKIAYAASFGVDYWDIPAGQTRQLKKLAKRFNAISVREAAGVELCRLNLDVEAIHVADPTLLLTDDDYLALTAPADHPEGRYIAAYILDGSRPTSKKAAVVSRAAGCPLVFTGKFTQKGFDSIERWVATIAFSEKVVTDSFHGTVFSLLFNKPVMILGNSLRGNSRFASLLETLSIEPDSDGFYRMTDASRNNLEQLRKKSLEFLGAALDAKVSSPLPNQCPNP